jgi:hypothetical protein
MGGPGAGHEPGTAAAAKAAEHRPREDLSGRSSSEIHGVGL